MNPQSHRKGAQRELPPPLPITDVAPFGHLFAEVLVVRGVDLHPRVDLQEVAQPVGVVSVAVGDDNEVQPRVVDAQGLDVVREDLGAVPRDEQDAAAAVLDERRIAPVHFKRRGFAEGVDQDRHPAGGAHVTRRRGWQNG
jgi:hypothetical protein